MELLEILNAPQADYFVGPWPEIENTPLFSEKPFVVVVRPQGPGNCAVRAFNNMQEAKWYMDMTLTEIPESKVAVYAFFNREWKKVDLVAK